MEEGEWTENQHTEEEPPTIFEYQAVQMQKYDDLQLDKERMGRAKKDGKEKEAEEKHVNSGNSGKQKRNRGKNKNKSNVPTLFRRPRIGPCKNQDKKRSQGSNNTTN